MPFKDPAKRSSYGKQHYNANKDMYRAARKRFKRRVKQFVIDLKNKPCTDCGEVYPPEAMEFDHVRGKKVASISRMVNHHKSLTLIKKELKKTELVCCLCHRLRTIRRRSGTL